MSLKDAFNALLGLKQVSVTVSRPGGGTYSAKISSSNYARDPLGPGATIIHGREFILPVDSIPLKLSPILKRGDRITHPNLGVLTIDEVREMNDLGDNIMGFRIRCD